MVDCGVTVIKAWCQYDTSWGRYGVIVTPLGVRLTPAKGVTVLTPLEGGVQLAQTLDTPFWCYHNTFVFTVYPYKCIVCEFGGFQNVLRDACVCAIPT